MLTISHSFTPFCIQAYIKIMTNPFPGMLHAERQLMTDVKHWHAALRVVRELGRTMFKQELIHIIHDVPDTVLCARKC